MGKGCVFEAVGGVNIVDGPGVGGDAFRYGSTCSVPGRKKVLCVALGSFALGCGGGSLS